MKLGDIVLDDNVCEQLLNKNGYCTKTILAKYESDTYYHGSIEVIDKYNTIEVKIAYKYWEKLDWIDAVPLLEDIHNYLYENVLNGIITKKFCEFLLN